MTELLIVADEGDARHVAEQAAHVTRLDARVLDWAEGADALEALGPAGTVLLEAEGVADRTLAAALPRIAAVLEAARVPVVVALATAQIDLVAAHLLGPSVQLLCEPTLADRAGALVLAGSGLGGGFQDPATGEDAARLAAMAEEVARVARALGELSRRRDGAVSDRDLGYLPPPSEEVAVAVSAADLRATIRSRRLRDAEFGAGWFEEPAWDMLLDLYAANLEGARVSVSSLCIAAAVPSTTALRWIARMTEAGLLERRPDPDDRRRAFMAMTARSRDGLTRYFAAARRAGLSIA